MILASDLGPYRTRDNARLFQTGAFRRLGRLEFSETGYRGSYGRKLYTRTNRAKFRNLGMPPEGEPTVEAGRC